MSLEVSGWAAGLLKDVYMSICKRHPKNRDHVPTSLHSLSENSQSVIPTLSAKGKEGNRVTGQKKKLDSLFRVLKDSLV